MDVIWEELRSKATDETLTSPLRPRDVACILKLRFDISSNIQQLEEISPPEQDVVPAIGSQEAQKDVFVIDGTLVKKARSYEEMNLVHAEGTTSQSPSRKRIRSDSDAYEEELIELYSRKGSSSSLSSRTQVAEEMKNRKEF